MSAEVVALLREIAAISAQIEEVAKCQEAIVVEKGSFDLDIKNFVETLTFSSEDDDSIKEVLSSHNLDEKTILTLQNVYERSTRALEEHARQQLQRLPALRLDEKTGIALCKCIQNHLMDAKRKLRCDLLECVGRRVALFYRDAERYSSEKVEPQRQDSNGKGHSKLAVAILEKAFARTANVTKAEKLKLASETGLEPRQVTIWFQNRRNRKPPAQVAGVSPSLALKRKRQEEDGADHGAPRRKCHSVALVNNLTDPALMSSDDSSNDTAFSSAHFSFTTSFKQSWSDTSSVDELQSVSGSELSSSRHAEGKAYDDSNDAIFDRHGRIMLDSNDLKLDLPRLERELRGLSPDNESLFIKPTPSAFARTPPAALSYDCFPKKPSASGATHVSTGFEAGISAYLRALFSPDINTIVANSQKDTACAMDQDDKGESDPELSKYLDLDSFLTPNTTFQTSSAPTSVGTPGSQPAASPADPFSFDMDALGLIDTHVANKASFEGSLELLPAALLDMSEVVSDASER